MKLKQVLATLVLVVLMLIVVTGCEGEIYDGGLPIEEVIRQVVDWIVANYDIAALVAALAISLWHDGLERAKALGVGLMLEAEKIAQNEIRLGGSEKMAFVVKKLVADLPPGVKQVLAGYAAIRGVSLDELLQEWCQAWYDVAVNAR